jgi:ribonucleoside-diphosphate reductase alpha chain
MRIIRRFTTAGTDVFSQFQWKRVRSVITETNGDVVFEMDGVEVPESWGQIAVDILASKYFRKAGVPCRNQDREFVDPDQCVGVSDGDDGYLKVGSTNGQHLLGSERSARQVVHRLALCWRTHGEKAGYFDSADDAEAFYDECVYMMLSQMVAPNSPQWFNAGLYEAYGVTGPSQGHYVADHVSGNTSVSESAYMHPQVHACYIQNVEDTLLRSGGIFDFVSREARLFKYGSGSGANFSKLRASGEPLSSGGKSSGLMSWLRIADASAGAIKSGGTTRRAAKMVVLDADHPNILDFIRLKAREELKVAAMVEGQRHLTDDEKAYAAKTGLNLTFDFNGEAYQTVTGQNANNSVRLTDDFMRKVTGVSDDTSWPLTRRTDGRVVSTLDARTVMDEIAEAAHRSADPGVQFDTTYNDWHTCPNSGRINATNPCSEYAFLDDTACNLASVNLVKFLHIPGAEGRPRTFDIEGYRHAVNIWTTVLEISVLMASYPSEEIAHRSWKFRTLGLGYANLGALLMRMGLPYDSEPGRAVAGALTSILTAQSYLSSAHLASEHGPFAGFADNRTAMLGVLVNHARCAGYHWGKASAFFRPIAVEPPRIDHECLSRIGSNTLANAAELSRVSMRIWSDTLDYGYTHGYRNAQTTVIAPTGTIGLLMECDTTGVEPDFSVVKFKKLAGGGMMRIVNESVTPALDALGMSPAQTADIIAYVLGRPSLDVDVDGASLAERLRQHGVTEARLAQIAKQLPTAYHVRYVIPELTTMGLSDAEVEGLDRVICGAKTLEGAPHLPVEYYAVFDTAAAGGTIGKRSISWLGHLRMMAAAQSFVSGSISKTVNMPRDATIEDVRAAYVEGWRLGIKAIALYRDGSKRSQPLNASAGTAATDISALRTQIDTLHRTILGRTAEDDTSRTALTAEATNFFTDTLSQAKRRRRRLPDNADAIRHKFQVGEVKGYVTVTLYDDGAPGEIFVQCSKAGSTLAGFIDSWAIAVSIMLQYGVPVEVIVRKFSWVAFAPHGMTPNPDIRFAKSLVDYIARWLGSRFVSGYAPQPHANTATLDAPPVEAVPARQRGHGRAVASTGIPTPFALTSDNSAMAVGANALAGADAPPCDACGMLMVSGGGCFRCANCGAGGSCG